MSKFGASAESEKEIKIVQKEGRRITCKWITKERGTLLQLRIGKKGLMFDTVKIKLG